jgi:hypothetical protein
MRYILVDGVDWNDPQEKAKLHVGTAMWDFVNLIRSGERVEAREEGDCPRRDRLFRDDDGRWKLYRHATLSGK